MRTIQPEQYEDKDIPFLSDKKSTKFEATKPNSKLVATIRNQMLFFAHSASKNLPPNTFVVFDKNIDEKIVR
jgi:hypothetical protein